MKQNLYTNKLEKILQSDGMIICSDVSDDGKKISFNNGTKLSTRYLCI